VCGLVGGRNEALAQRQTAAPFGVPATSAPAAITGGELIVVPALAGDKWQILTVIDPRQRVMSVYHVELATGKITLRSVRNIHWDLQLEQMNSDNPSPTDIKSQMIK
jgi:hypothetical protein